MFKLSFRNNSSCNCHFNNGGTYLQEKFVDLHMGDLTEGMWKKIEKQTIY